MAHVPLAFLSCFDLDFVLVLIWPIIQLILNELFLSVASLLNVRWLMMNDYEMLRMFSKYVNEKKVFNFTLKLT